MVYGKINSIFGMVLITKSLKQFAKKNLNKNNYCFCEAGVW